MPCPNGVDIPLNFYAYNRGIMHGDLDFCRFIYSRAIPEECQAQKCIQCRECEEKCTQHIEISEWMPQVHAVLGEQQPYLTQ